MPSGNPVAKTVQFHTKRSSRYLGCNVLFQKVSSEYIDISFAFRDGNGRTNPVDVINVFDYRNGVSAVNTVEEFRSVVDEYMGDQDNINDLNRMLGM